MLEGERMGVVAVQAVRKMIKNKYLGIELKVNGRRKPDLDGRQSLQRQHKIA
jgi:hypothetical protein